MYIKTHNELPTQSRNILPPSEHLEAKDAGSHKRIAECSRQLLKAQLLAGQHSLDKQQFVKVAKQHGWILQIPQRLLL